MQCVSIVIGDANSLPSLLDTYYILGLVPLLKPLGIFPHWVATTFKSFLIHKFDSIAKLKVSSDHFILPVWPVARPDRDVWRVRVGAHGST